MVHCNRPVNEVFMWNSDSGGICGSASTPAPFARSGKREKETAIRVAICSKPA